MAKATDNNTVQILCGNGNCSVITTDGVQHDAYALAKGKPLTQFTKLIDDLVYNDAGALFVYDECEAKLGAGETVPVANWQPWSSI